MLSQDAQNWIDAQADEFMQPVAEYFSAAEAAEYCAGQQELIHGEDEPAQAGWYARLSAPGYMDCTDWQGPYDSEEDALQGLYESYGD